MHIYIYVLYIYYIYDGGTKKISVQRRMSRLKDGNMIRLYHLNLLEASLNLLQACPNLFASKNVR